MLVMQINEIAHYLLPTVLIIGIYINEIITFSFFFIDYYVEHHDSKNNDEW